MRNSGLGPAKILQFEAKEERGKEGASKILSHRALSAEERERVLQVLNEDRFVDKAPETIHAMLLDDGFNLCSARTMYRILKQNGLVKERRRIARHKKFAQPELAASRPKQVWCWDVTKLRGARKGEYFYLYVAIDIYSRYVVGWMVANQESAGLAKEFIEHICQKQEIEQIH